ncbi:hypothetical protein BP5796_06209 [Coleophoma crateriformis]|uniref:PH domain-containing protein n=1 Tax=Coleophoma crateriformis TaxID=565419 RepID=A0A3D8RWD4_9HELO|nr:hypothetical protein BP5796_06209 [Coleophoma crateriformis]
MGNRSRVFSFMSSFSNRDSKSPEPTSAPSPINTRQATFKKEVPNPSATSPTSVFPNFQQPTDGESSQPRASGRARAPSAPAGSRPVSMIQTYQPPLMELSHDTLPELQPIFTFLNSHANKLYQEGYFLKLDDQSVQGRANADRTWTECFAQLVGTVLSLWDAQELDAADGKSHAPVVVHVLTIQIESLPTRAQNEAPLQNVLSISTAGKNRYLLHFNSHHSLIQWTAGIRLAMYEHSTLQEAYTGALIAGKGKTLNNINMIMDRSRVKHEDWARVRFGAGTPWRRCWCVISPPDEKEVQKLQKDLKKKSVYDRSKPPLLKGDIKFYDTKRTKKTMPIATITNAYSAFAIYPQSKPLIDASTLVKVEGNITIHSNPESTTEGFVFVMPEVHPAVTGFEMLLRWLFPVFDTFGLYGRPGRLVADTLDPRSLMFAMPKQRRYGYLEILDVSALVLEPGSGEWKESEWRKKMKELTGRRITAIESGSRSNSRYSSRRNTRNSFGPSRSRVAFDDTVSIRSSPSMTWNSPPSDAAPYGGIPRTDSAPPAQSPFDTPKKQAVLHNRSVSETQGLDQYQTTSAMSYDGTYDGEPQPPPPPPHHAPVKYKNEMAATPERVSSEDDSCVTPIRELQELQVTSTPEPVAAPPAFAHGPGSLPISKPYHSPELRRANSRMSNATLTQLAGAGGVTYDGTSPRASDEQGRQNVGRQPEEHDHREVLLSNANTKDVANQYDPEEGVVAVNRRFSFEQPPTPSKSDPKPDGGHSYSQQQSSKFFPSDNTSSYTSEQQPEVPPHSQKPSTDYNLSQPSRNSVGLNIARKPLPQRSSYMPSSDATTPVVIAPFTDFGNKVIDQATFDRIRDSQTIPDRQVHKQNSTISSMDDTASTASPDYASTSRSVEMRESVDRPRAGVMRTVGDPEMSAPLGMADLGLPDINFGPTINYASDRPLPQTPAPITPDQRGPSPAQGFPGPSRSPGEKSFAPNQGPQKVDPPESRTVAWQPGMGAINKAAHNQHILTPEQFVKQRANPTPMYAHQRQHSSTNLLHPSTPTPPAHSRNNSADLLQRPNSRGPSAVLGSGSGDYSTHLSAREQEHVARVTGQPLINMASNKPTSPGVGLVGAIDLREKEKQQMKQGLTSQAVQNAIAQRQSMVYSQYPDLSPGDYRAPQSQYGVSPTQIPPQLRPQSWVSPTANAFAQGGGWMHPSVQSPAERSVPQQQYFSQQQYPQGRGGNQRNSGNGY